MQVTPFFAISFFLNIKGVQFEECNITYEEDSDVQLWSYFWLALVNMLCGIFMHFVSLRE